MKDNNELISHNNTMPAIVSRRRLLAQVGVVFGLSVAGCSELSSDPSGDPIEPEKTDPIQVQGEPITITRDISSMSTDTVENTAVALEEGEDIATSDLMLSSKRVQLVKSAINDMVVKQIGTPRKGHFDWYLQWDVSNARLLITTVMTIDSRGGDYVFPPPDHTELKLNLPSVVTVVIQTDERAISTDIPIYIRARLQPT